jgi:hypothetical protein
MKLEAEARNRSTSAFHEGRSDDLRSTGLTTASSPMTGLSIAEPAYQRLMLINC